MKWIIIFLLALMSVVLVSILFIQDPGYVKMIWIGYEVQLSAIFAVLLFFFLFFIFIVFAGAISWLLGIPSKWLSFFKKSQNEKAHHELLKLLSSDQAEDTESALDHQKKAAETLSLDPLFLWISGNALERAEKHLEAERCFVDLTKNPSTLFLGLKGQIRAALQRGDFNKAYDFLNRAEKIVPSSPWVLKHLLALVRQKEKHEEEEALILRLEDLGYFTSAQSKNQIAHSQYKQALELNISLAQKEAFLRQAHYLDPALSEATEALALLLKDQRQVTYAVTTIEETWSLAPSQRLGDIYLKVCSPEDKVKAFQKAQDLVNYNPNHLESLLFIARTALDAKLWGEARSSLMTLLGKKPTADVYQFLARLELEEKGDEKAALKWLEESIHVPRHV